MGFGFLKKIILGGGEGSQKPFGKSKEPEKKRPKILPTQTPKRHVPQSMSKPQLVGDKPYACARFVNIVHGSDGHVQRKGFFDGRCGERQERLQRYGLPILETPESLATWLAVPIRTLAWLSDYHGQNSGEHIPKKQHYHYKWLKKSRGDEFRLLEAPKPLLKHCQQRVLRGMLDLLPPHPAAHAFVRGRGIKSNAWVHAGKFVIVKADLADFYPSIPFKRIRSVFYGMGYNTEISLWLARLCTNSSPYDLPGPDGKKDSFWPYSFFYSGRHLPQGAPTSPALANLSAWGLDVRLTGLARKFGMAYTRYADDLTFSGGEECMQKRSMNVFVRYLRGIVRNERFRWKSRKFKIFRRGNRQLVTGLTVNQKPNIPKQDYLRLRALLFNCVRQGAASQNRERHADFRAHLSGKVAYVRYIHPERGEKLQKLFDAVKTWG